MKSRSVLLATAVFALPVTASAQSVTGLCVGATAGVNHTQDETVESIAANTPSDSIGFRVGPTTTGSLRWSFGNGLHEEIESNSCYNQVEDASGFGTGSRSGGNEHRPGTMYNSIYDLVDPTPWVQSNIYTTV
jgi:hypothetical protein